VMAVLDRLEPHRHRRLLVVVIQHVTRPNPARIAKAARLAPHLHHVVVGDGLPIAELPRSRRGGQR